MQYRIRAAEDSDIESLRDLISLSAHSLSKGDYTYEQVEAALMGVFGVDTQLINDQTYFVVETNTGRMVACGGWSFRATLFGNDQLADRDPRRLDPSIEAAKIRAFFVHPDFARQGLGKKLLDHCEQCAREAGFKNLELGATLPGKRLYEVCGYTAGVQVDHIMENGLVLQVIPMYKTFEDEI
ncbi:MAG: GNAT family N-acetyltransferase [Cyclobacteriaceae bacterium]|nr:GNAT family N-acetyltransferase [Cyclobacteriaceae bacterium]